MSNMVEVRALVPFICGGDPCAMYTELISNAARTGRHGDGSVSLHPVGGVTKILTGAEDLAALE